MEPDGARGELTEVWSTPEDRRATQSNHTRAACPGRLCRVALGSGSNCDPPCRHGEVLSPRTPKRALIWKWGLCRWSQVKRRSFPSNPTKTLIQGDWSPHKKGEIQRQICMEGRCCEMQGERSEMRDKEKGVMLLSAKGRQALPATPEARGGAGPRFYLRKTWSCQHRFHTTSFRGRRPTPLLLQAARSDPRLQESPVGTAADLRRRDREVRKDSLKM